jgi:hypothetical protein
MEHGAVRLFEADKALREMEKEKDRQEEEEKQNAMKQLEKRTKMSRTEMEAIGNDFFHFLHIFKDANFLYRFRKTGRITRAQASRRQDRLRQRHCRSH